MPDYKLRPFVGIMLNESYAQRVSRVYPGIRKDYVSFCVLAAATGTAQAGRIASGDEEGTEDENRGDFQRTASLAYPQTAALGTTQAVTATGPEVSARTQPAAVTEAVAGELTDQAKPVTPETLVLAWKRSESPTARVWPVGATETDGTPVEGGGPGAVAVEEPSHADAANQRTQESFRTESFTVNTAPKTANTPRRAL